jgi:hypothetical protein
MDYISGFLPGGLIDSKGIVHQEVKLSCLNGRAEYLLSNQQVREPNALVTILLSRCIHQIGTIKPVSQELIRNLLVADRQYLLLKMIEAMFGDKVEGTIVCPNASCGNKVDIDFAVGDIPIKASNDKGPLYKMQLKEQANKAEENLDHYIEVVFRLPNGSDQEAIIPLIQQDKHMAAVTLLGRCIKRIGTWENPGPERVAGLPPHALIEIEKKMEEIAPVVELTMAGECPECGVSFTVPFELMGYFWSKLQISCDQLLREIHYLALHYHWSEREIMEMPRQLRHQYLKILAEEIKRLKGDI